jgi:hypothetical protein
MTIWIARALNLADHEDEATILATIKSMQAEIRMLRTLWRSKAAARADCSCKPFRLGKWTGIEINNACPRHGLNGPFMRNW